MIHDTRRSGAGLATLSRSRSGVARPVTSSVLVRARPRGDESRSVGLLRRIGAGDAQALAEFYDLHCGLVNGLALRIVRERGDAEDVVQEVFVQAWRQAARFDAARGTPEAWLCTIARSRALDKLRRRAARREDAGDDASGSAGRDPAQGAAPQAELALAVRQALRGLSHDQRAALELAYYEGLSQSEIAARLGEPLGTVKTRIRTAMLRLRTTLEPLQP
jgi:RNA polymerase sigma-70 factor (ECF subfamily)